MGSGVTANVLCVSCYGKWELSFQYAPEKRIILYGDEPTREEITAALATSTYAPAWLIPLCEVAAAVAERRPNK